MIDYTKKEEDDSKLTPRQTAIGTGIVLCIVIFMIYGFYGFYKELEKAQNMSTITQVQGSSQISVGTRMLVKPLSAHKTNHDWTQEVIEVKVLDITDGSDKYMKFVDSNGVYTWKRYSEITVVKVLN